MKIQLNEETGLNKGAKVVVGDREITVTVLSVADSRATWVKIQPWVRGMMMAEDLGKGGVGVGAVAMASIAGALNDETFSHLVDTFAKYSSYLMVEQAVSGNAVESKRFLKEKGQMDTVFVGSFESLVEWVDVCIQLNFGKLIEKLLGAIAVNESPKEPGTSASDLAPKATPNPQFV